ncbi:hypothetical protein [Sinomonas sp. R1AF57]|uniref:hypothetical protein n=1 Tax=Sinomonas sp. R1AF57 TaxID=2020377 RepID=UPI000B615F83|nr:hypothetical protein [Sinomonas sp. R1AF57]ASN52503.1 hypothetical protein CGQ25_10800 [Sinomonas sp. R1AF57]
MKAEIAEGAARAHAWEYQTALGAHAVWEAVFHYARGHGGGRSTASLRPVARRPRSVVVQVPAEAMIDRAEALGWIEWREGLWWPGSLRPEDTPGAGLPQYAPTAPVLRAARRSRHESHWLLTVRCPYCGGLHAHGSGGLDLSGDLGQRVPHCPPPNRPYQLRLTEEVRPETDEVAPEDGTR